jgi:hypothetical protein
MTQRNAAAIARLEQRMEQFIQQAEADREFMRTEIQGIKIETQRIIRHLFGEDLI